MKASKFGRLNGHQIILNEFSSKTMQKVITHFITCSTSFHAAHVLATETKLHSLASGSAGIICPEGYTLPKFLMVTFIMLQQCLSSPDLYTNRTFNSCFPPLSLCEVAQFSSAKRKKEEVGNKFTYLSDLPTIRVLCSQPTKDLLRWWGGSWESRGKLYNQATNAVMSFLFFYFPFVFFSFLPLKSHNLSDVILLFLNIFWSSDKGS